MFKTVLLSLLVILTPLSLAQDRVPVPVPGRYVFDGEIERVAMNGDEVSENPPFMRGLHLSPSPCGDSLQFGMSRYATQAVLAFSEDRYSGGFNVNDQPQTITLFPVAPNRVRVRWTNESGDGEPLFSLSGGVGDVWSIETEVYYSLRSELVGPEQNLGKGVFDSRVTNERRLGPIWIEEEIFYTVALWDFDVNASELQSEHERVIEEALTHAIEQEDALAETVMCQRIKSVTMSGEVHGYASQTGPERTNRRLAGQRAEAVSQRIGERAPELYPDSWIGRPFPRAISGPLGVNHPGLESACNRAAYFQFAVTREFVEPYSLDEAQAWLERDLRNACGGAPEQLLDVEHRRNAKARYVLASNYLDMIAAGHCTPPQGAPAHRLLQRSQLSADNENSAESSLYAAYDLANAPENNPYVVGLDYESAGSRHQARSSTDPYYRYTYDPRSEEEGAFVDAMESAICGSVTPPAFD